MSLLPSRNSSRDKASGKVIIAAVCEQFFEGDERKVEMIGEEMEAQENRGEIGGEEAMDEVGSRVVVGGGERSRGRECMVPGTVKGGKGGVGGVQSVSVECVCQDFT